jgi:hypothetical protein
VLSEPEFDVNDTEEIVGAVVSTVTVKPDDVATTVESAKIAVDSAVMTLSPAVKTAVSQLQIPVTESATQVFPDATPSTNN